MRILIGGEDDLAFRLAEALMADHEVVMVVPEFARGPKLDRLDVEVVIGSTTGTEALRQAGVGAADMFVACTSADERNLVACVAAKRLGVARTVCFLVGRDLKATEDDASALAESLDIDMVVRPSQRLAEEILRITAVSGALDVEIFAGGRVRLVRHSVEESSPITQAPLKDVGVPTGVVLVMARRGDETFIPKGDTLLLPGDQVIAMGTLVGVNKLRSRYLRNEGRRIDAHRATVVGSGVVGLAVATGLEETGWDVKVIETDKKRCEQVAPLLKSLVLHGDGADLDLLEEERISDDSVLVAVTSNDEKNLLVSLLAKELGVPRIVTRVDTPANERLFERVGIDVVRSARGAAINSVVRSISADESELLAELEHGDEVVIHLDVPEAFPSTELRELDGPISAIIGAILRGRKVVIPQGRDTIKGGDRLLVFCKSADEKQVRRFFRNPTVRGGR